MTKRKIWTDPTLDQDAFIAFLRATTQKPRPVWEQSVIRYAISTVRPRELEGIDYRDKENYPALLKAFNDWAHTPSPSKMGDGNRRVNGGPCVNLAYQGTCRR